MNSIYKIIPIFLLITSCALSSSDKSEQSRQEILKVDEEMSSLSQRNGFQRALVVFGEDSLIKPEGGMFPIIGKQALQTYYASQEDIKGMSWKPIRAEAAKSGELGYSFGNWKYETLDTTYYGNYYTVWRRQADGSWKWILDGGNPTPQPPE